MKRKHTDSESCSKKEKTDGERRRNKRMSVAIKDNIVIARNALTDVEQIDLYKKMKELSDYPDGRKQDHWATMFTKNVSCHNTSKEAHIARILSRINGRICDKIKNDLSPVPKSIKNMMELLPVAMVAIEYNNENGKMTPHRDKWSTWNMVVCLGGSSELKYNEGTFKLNGGDVYIFNGNEQVHSVVMSNEGDNYLWSQMIGYPHRVCLQLRVIHPDRLDDAWRDFYYTVCEL